MAAIDKSHRHDGVGLELSRGLPFTGCVHGSPPGGNSPAHLLGLLETFIHGTQGVVLRAQNPPVGSKGTTSKSTNPHRLSLKAVEPAFRVKDEPHFKWAGERVVALRFPPRDFRSSY